MRYQFRFYPQPCVVCGADPVLEEICGDDIWYFCEEHQVEALWPESVSDDDSE